MILHKGAQREGSLRQLFNSSCVILFISLFIPLETNERTHSLTPLLTNEPSLSSLFYGRQYKQTALHNNTGRANNITQQQHNSTALSILLPLSLALGSLARLQLPIGQRLQSRFPIARDSDRRPLSGVPIGQKRAKAAGPNWSRVAPLFFSLPFESS